MQQHSGILIRAKKPKQKELIGKILYNVDLKNK
jgi:hypothetical protein